MLQKKSANIQPQKSMFRATVDVSATFSHKSDIKPWLQSQVAAFQFAVAIERSDHVKIVFRCKSGSALCPFRLRANYSVRSGRWSLVLMCDLHDHRVGGPEVEDPRKGGTKWEQKRKGVKEHGRRNQKEQRRLGHPKKFAEASFVSERPDRGYSESAYEKTYGAERIYDRLADRNLERHLDDRSLSDRHLLSGNLLADRNLLSDRNSLGNLSERSVLTEKNFLSEKNLLSERSLLPERNPTERGVSDRQDTIRPDLDPSVDSVVRRTVSQFTQLVQRHIWQNQALPPDQKEAAVARVVAELVDEYLGDTRAPAATHTMPLSPLLNEDASAPQLPGLDGPSRGSGPLPPFTQLQKRLPLLPAPDGKTLNPVQLMKTADLREFKVDNLGSVLFALPQDRADLVGLANLSYSWASD